MGEDIRNRQEHIQFLESYIVELTNKIDELTGGRDIEKAIRSLEYRVECLRKSDGQFNGCAQQLQIELDAIKSEYTKLKPVLEQLEEERAFYRHLQTEL